MGDSVSLEVTHHIYEAPVATATPTPGASSSPTSQPIPKPTVNNPKPPKDDD